MQGNTFASITELIFAFALFYSFINLRIEKDIEKNSLQANYLLFFVILIVLFMFRFGEGVIFWALLFPFSTTILVGYRLGLRFIIVFNLIVYVFTYYYWRMDGVELIEYIRFITVSLIIVLLVYFYEKNFSESLEIQKELNTSLTESMKEIKTLAITDSLTKLYNKRHFDTILSEEFNRAKRANEPFILAIIDVDNFKLYNDTYGHDEGNIVLEKIGKVLKMQTLRSGDFAFRIGGEEFALILQSSSEEDIYMYFENLRKKVIEEHIEHVKNMPFGVITVSVGIVSISNYEKITILDAYHAADKNLYAIKNNGRNAIQFSDI